jgi:transcriptional regulator with XRE-family HTH domain
MPTLPRQPRSGDGEAQRSRLGSDPELFRREILPRLRTVSLAEIMAAAGCSKASASDYRRGKRTPHVSTWQRLAELVGSESTSMAEAKQ